LALIVIHSITEQLFLLKEFFAAIHALEGFSRSEFEGFIDAIEANDIQPACRAFFPLVALLSRRAFDRIPPYLDEILLTYPPFRSELDAFREAGLQTPHRYTTRTGISTVLGKMTNRTFLQSVLVQMPSLAQPSTLSHIGKELLTRRKREHYAVDTLETKNQGPG